MTGGVGAAPAGDAHAERTIRPIPGGYRITTVAPYEFSTTTVIRYSGGISVFESGNPRTRVIVHPDGDGSLEIDDITIIDRDERDDW